MFQCLFSLLTVHDPRLTCLQAECERTKNIQNEFESLWRGMERLMTQHRPLTGKNGEEREAAGAGGAGGVSSASIKELLGRIDGALLHVDQGIRIVSAPPPSDWCGVFSMGGGIGRHLSLRSLSSLFESDRLSSQKRTQHKTNPPIPKTKFRTRSPRQGTALPRCGWREREPD